MQRELHRVLLARNLDFLQTIVFGRPRVRYWYDWLAEPGTSELQRWKGIFFDITTFPGEPPRFEPSTLLLQRLLAFEDVGCEVRVKPWPMSSYERTLHWTGLEQVVLECLASSLQQNKRRAKGVWKPRPGAGEADNPMRIRVPHQ